jgi:hypothetical protein
LGKKIEVKEDKEDKGDKDDSMSLKILCCKVF